MSHREVEIRIEYTARGPTAQPSPEDKHIKIRAQPNNYVEIEQNAQTVGAGNTDIPGVTTHLDNILDHLLGNSKLTREIMGFIITKTPKSP